MSHPKHEIYQVHSADTKETAVTTDRNGKVVLLSSLLEKDMGEGIPQVLKDKLELAATGIEKNELWSEWDEAALDCRYNQIGLEHPICLHENAKEFHRCRNNCPRI